MKRVRLRIEISGLCGLMMHLMYWGMELEQCSSRQINSICLSQLDYVLIAQIMWQSIKHVPWGSEQRLNLGLSFSRCMGIQH